VEGKKLKNIMKDEKARKAEAEALTSDVDGLRGQVEHATGARKRAEDKLGEIREAYGQRATAQARAIEMTRREATELGEEIKTAVDQRRAAEATRVSLEREQETATAKHTAAVAEMITTMKHFSSAVSGYNGALLGSLGQVEGVPFARGEGGL
jgi:predicted  nucleic acid-binding Zn-ribbon protein